MLSSPKPGQRVQVWYGPKAKWAMPHHGKVGRVTTVGTGRPRNHGVTLDDGACIVVPAGNLRAEGRP